MTPAWLPDLHRLLLAADPPDMRRRANHVTQPGRADRRSTILLPLLTRWAQHRHVGKDPAPHIGKARKGFRLIVADRRRRA